MDINHYINDIKRHLDTADSLSESNPMDLQKKIDLLIEAHVMLGDVEAEYTRIYKTSRVQAKAIYWDAYENATGNKKMAAEKAVLEVMNREAEAYSDAKKYGNRFNSVEEQIHAIKLKHNTNIKDGTLSGNYVGG